MTNTPSHPLPRPIARKLGRVRAAIRTYAAVEGVAAVIALLAVMFWGALALDWMLELPVPVRAGLWAISLIGAAVVLWLAVVSRVFAPISRSSIALVLERLRPEIGGSLATAVDVSITAGPASPQLEDLIQETNRRASSRLKGVPVSAVFAYGPLLWKATAAAGLVGLIFAFASTSPETFGLWIDRLMLGDEPWPRRVALEVDGFEQVDGRWVANVARDDSFLLRVRASLEDGHVAPERVDIRYRLADGRRSRDTMTRVGEADATALPWQEFTYKFDSVADDVRLDIVGGDDRIRGLHLHVVERPRVLHTAVEVFYPEYLQQDARTIPFSGRVELPEGSSALLRIESSKPLTGLVAHDAESQTDLPSVITGAENSFCRVELANLSDSRTLLLTLNDTDGVSNDTPYRLLIDVVPDELPEVLLRPSGIGSAITPNARVPMEGTIEDDHGVADAWFELKRTDAELHKRPLRPARTRPAVLEGPAVFDLADTDPLSGEPLVELEVGEKIQLSAAARDAYNLKPGLRESRSAPVVLEVVTPSDLRAILEKRELNLRQRFEAIVERTEATRDLLDKIGLPADGASRGPAEQRELDNLRLDGVGRNATQMAYETQGMADGFDDIVAELKNNRVDTRELLQRLSEGIVQPLREVADTLLPRLEASVERCSKAENEADLQRLLTTAKKDGDAAVEAMRAVLDRMLELESYNELVELLRTLIDDQKQLNEQTEAERKARLRSLLED